MRCSVLGASHGTLFIQNVIFLGYYICFYSVIFTPGIVSFGSVILKVFLGLGTVLSHWGVLNTIGINMVSLTWWSNERIAAFDNLRLRVVQSIAYGIKNAVFVFLLRSKRTSRNIHGVWIIFLKVYTTRRPIEISSLIQWSTIIWDLKTSLRRVILNVVSTILKLHSISLSGNGWHIYAILRCSDDSLFANRFFYYETIY